MAKKSDLKLGDGGDNAEKQPPEDAGSGTLSVQEKDDELSEDQRRKQAVIANAAKDPTRKPEVGEVVAYVPHVNDLVGAGHCKATCTALNADGTVDLAVHGPNGDFNVAAVDLGPAHKPPRSYYWGGVDAAEEGRGA